MKKIVLLFVFVVAALFGARAQDTVNLLDVRDLENYYVPSGWPHFPENYTYNDYWKMYEGGIMGHGQNHEQEAAWGFRVLTEDTLEVYGIAAVVARESDNIWPNNDDEPVEGDTSTHNAYTWLMLFASESDTLRPLVDTSYTYVHAWQTPQYYVKFGWGHPGSPHPGYPAMPVFERYFPQAVTVADSFYLGYIVQQEYGMRALYDLCFIFVHFDFHAPYNQDTLKLMTRIHYKYYNSNLDDTVDHWYSRLYTDDIEQHPLFFPIITPPDTTVVNPGGGSDTTVVNPGGGSDSTMGVRGADLLNRYTGVTPNPANGMVRVTSSFGLSGVDVFETSGRRVCSMKAEGLALKLDVSAWPRGTYVVHIKTPLGTAVKKLVLQ